MEMDEFQAMRQPRGLQHLTRCYQVGGIESELGVLATARGPSAGTFAMQSYANPDVRFNPNFFRCANGVFQLLQFFDYDDGGLAEFASEQRNPNERLILVSVTDNQALRILVHGQGGDQLRFTSRFQSKMKLLTGIDNFLHHFAQLVDLDRKHTSISPAVTE